MFDLSWFKPSLLCHHNDYRMHLRFLKYTFREQFKAKKLIPAMYLCMEIIFFLDLPVKKFVQPVR
jgi:hypothetical protein